MSNHPAYTPNTTTQERFQQHAATTGAQSSPNSITHPTINPTGTSNPAPGNHTEEELEAAATMLTLRNPVGYTREEVQAATTMLSLSNTVRYSNEDVEAAHVLLAMAGPADPPGSDGERTITDSERTVTAEPTPATTPTRRAGRPGATPAPTPSSGDASMVRDSAGVSTSPPVVKKISLTEYMAMKKARRDQEN